MEKETLSVSDFDFWSMTDKVHHQILLIRQRELSPYHIASQQLYILRMVEALGSQATVSKIARETNREVGVVARQVVVLEKDGLIKRIKRAPKSRQLRIELTEQGIHMLKIPKESKTVRAIFSILTEKERWQTYSILKRLFIKSKEYTNLPPIVIS